MFQTQIGTLDGCAELRCAVLRYFYGHITVEAAGSGLPPGLFSIAGLLVGGPGRDTESCNLLGALRDALKFQIRT